MTVEAGNSPARLAVECSHGVAGYCHDDALPEERAAVEFLHGSAFAWALATETHDRGLAEEFAAWTVREAWRPGEVLLDRSHRRDWSRFPPADRGIRRPAGPSRR